LDSDLRVCHKKGLRNPDKRSIGNNDPQIFQQLGSHQLVNQYAAMLGVLQEFYDVDLPIFCLDEVGLAPAPELSEENTRVVGREHKDPQS
jgi:hypothetical protein